MKMQIIVCLNAGESIVSLEVDEDCLTKELKGKCESLWGMSHNKMEIFRDGEILDDLQTLKQCRIVEDDFLCVLTPEEEENSMSTNSNEHPSELLLMPPSYAISMENFNLNPQDSLSVGEEFLEATMDMLRQSNSKLSSALEKENLSIYFRVLVDQVDHQTYLYKQLCKEQANCINAAGMQDNRQVDQVISNADDEMKMLIIACKVNGVLTKAGIDSGAQVTVISERFADQCKIKHLIDTRYYGIDKGIGRIHEVDVQIGDTLITVGITVVEQLAVDMLIGLDIMRAHNCLIDFKRNIFMIGNTETEFLKENIDADHNGIKILGHMDIYLS